MANFPNSMRMQRKGYVAESFIVHSYAFWISVFSHTGKYLINKNMIKIKRQKKDENRCTVWVE